MTTMMMGGANYGLRRTTVLSTSLPDHREALHSIVNSRDHTASPFAMMSDQQGSPASSPSSNDASNSLIEPSSPSNLRGAPKECGVCGDVAKSMHFGGLSCDSCKAFFRRSVQNNAYKGFSCPYEKNCFIGVSSRKACQFCRFQKCVSIGMEKSWVMTEDERRRMMTQRQIRKKEQDDGVRMVPESTEDENSYALSEEDRSEIYLIVSLYKKAYNEIPYEDQRSCSKEASASVLAPWMTFCKRIAYFFTLFKDFADLDSADQVLLLKTAITSAGIIMGSVVYDSSNGKWASRTYTKTNHEPNVTFQSVEKMVPSDLFSRIDKFFKKFQTICPDETMGMILILITLYSPELMGLQARETVQSLQDRYIRILHHYVKFKFKEKSAVMFPKAIVSLADIRELADRTWQMKINEKFQSGFTDFMKGPLNHGAPKSVGACTKMENGNFGSLSSETASNRTRLAATGDARDLIYQKIIEKVLDHMHTSAKHIRAPSLLPFIVQIVKKFSKQRQDDKEDKAINLESNSGSRRSSHRYHQRMHRHGHKRRLVEVKHEVNSSSLFVPSNSFTEPMEDIIIKTEIMETDSNDDYNMASSSSDSSPINSFSAPYSSGERFLVQCPSTSTSNSQYTLNPSQSRIPDSFNNCSIDHETASQSFEIHSLTRVGIQGIAQGHTLNQTVPLPQNPHYSKPIYQQTEYHHQQTQPCGQELTELVPVDSSFGHIATAGTNMSSNPVQASSYPTHSLHAGNTYTFISQREPGSISPTNMSTSHPKDVHMQILTNPHQMSPISSFSSVSNSLTHPINNTLQPYTLQHQPSPPDPAHSPYSSSSSSSSPEDFSQSSTADLASSDISEIELDIISQLLESLNNAEGVNSIKESFPPQFLKELEKLGGFNNDSSPHLN